MARLLVAQLAATRGAAGVSLAAAAVRHCTKRLKEQKESDGEEL